MRRPLVLVLVLVVASVVAACSSPDPIAARQLPEAVRADAAAIADSNNQFACDAFAKLPVGNVFFSPFSISTALAMVDAGAAGATDAELRAALHFTLPGEQTHAAYGALLASLDKGRSFGGYTLATANRLFGQDGFSFLPEFVERTKTDYRAELMTLDFANASEDARRTINDWVAAQTDGKISELFPAGTISSGTILALVNAIVFKGNWVHHFDHGGTHEGPFMLPGGGSVTATLMHKQDDIAIARITGARVGVLPFDGKDLSMVVVVPDTADGLPAVEAQLGGAAIRDWIDGARATGEQLDVILPKFGLRSALPLEELLQSLGIVTAFDPSTADLSGMDGGRDLFVAHALHQAVVSVDEDGAEAAAATGVGISDTSVPEAFEADRPFLFFIYDHVTGSILFMGRLVDPTH